MLTASPRECTFSLVKLPTVTGILILGFCALIDYGIKNAGDVLGSNQGSLKPSPVHLASGDEVCELF